MQHIEQPQNVEDEHRLTVADLASFYQVGTWKVRYWVRKGMPCERLGMRTIRFKMTEVRAWLASRVGAS